MSSIELNLEFRPLNKYVMIVLDSSPKKDSSIFIPDNIKEARRWSGVVVSISQDVQDEVYGVDEDGSPGESEGLVCDIELGDRVFFEGDFVKLKEFKSIDDLSVSIDGEKVDIDRLVCVKYNKLIGKVGA
eukprot:TRINITY_DN56642_c0_g1_i1.p1 TRINITY_DN56642_c0_g1~~TRINITY_DN56642_c0_g1_i1.p1  ORF type:complete len:130 (-),score=8.25 TRINITY_DN56642_c0_g1_i1:233-622(-)